MTSNKRIFLNIVATYGRSVLAIVCGLFTSRWVLMALGKVDFGLYGLVGGLTAFIAFFNTLLAGTLGRFYAYSLGKRSIAQSDAEDIIECRRWFSIAVMIHTVVPTILMLVGYPVGMWAVRYFLTIPVDRIEDCVIIFRLVCFSCFVGMVSVPFTAMYTAKQYIAELTLYSIATTILNFCFFYYMVSTPGNWLVKYGWWLCCASTIPQILICIRALMVFPECCFVLSYCLDRSRLRRILTFSFWQMFGSLGWLVRSQGVAIVVNKFFGPALNASMSLATSVNAYTSTLSAAMQGAFTPAITSACGSGDDELMRRMAFRANRLGMIGALIFLIPCGVELPEILRLWLKNPPEHTALLCVAMMIALVIDKSSLGQNICVYAKGKMALYQCVLGVSLMMSLPLTILLIHLGYGVCSIALALVGSVVMCALGRVWFGRTLVGMSAVVWLRTCIIPVALASGCSMIVAFLPHLFMKPSFLRVLVTTVFAELALVPITWFAVVSRDERAFVQEKCLSLIFRRKV